MVIIDQMNLPPKKIMISIAVLIILIIGCVFGYLHKQKTEADKLSRMKQQQMQKERNDQSSYESGLDRIFNSPNIYGVFQLYDKLLKDFSFMQIAGWKKDQILCEVDSCNVRFVKMEDRIFEYVSLKKSGNTYDPIFNQKDLTYQNVVYDIDKGANVLMRENMDGIFTCTDFIANTYQLISLLAKSKNTKQQLAIQLPNNVFNFSKEYDWAAFAKIKKGILNYKTPDFYTVSYIRDKFMGQLLVFDRFMIDKGQIDVTFSYYCF